MGIFKIATTGILVILVASQGYEYYTKAYMFDADDPKRSMHAMINTADPLEREIFQQKFMIACDDGIRCINLHELTKKEISEIADEKLKN